MVKKTRKINCVLTKNMKDNYNMWVAKMEEEERQKAISDKLESIQQVGPIFNLFFFCKDLW